jgi:hypothetical protein
MSYRKQGLRALGLSFVAVLGLMVFMVVGAQAAFLYFQPTTKTLTGESEPTISAHTDGTLLVPGLNFKILCQKVESDPASRVKILASSPVAHGSLLFRECESFSISSNILQGNCTPKSPGAAAGEILAGGLAELISHEGKSYILFRPSAGKQLGTIIFPETCGIETVNVTGTFVAECGILNTSNEYLGGSCATHRVEQLLRPAPQELFSSDKLQFLGREASLDGIAAVKFGAPCAGCSWGGDAAQARFLYLEGGGVTESLVVDSAPAFSLDESGTLLIPNKNLKISCQKTTSDPKAPVKFLGETNVARGHLIFTECESFDMKTSTLQKNCTPKSVGAAAGEILAGGFAELILHPASNTIVLVRPLIGKAFTTIELPELCALSETSNVTGEIIVECGELKPEKTYVAGGCSTLRAAQLLREVSEALRTELGYKLKFGANEAFLDGISSVQFGEPCESCSWGGDAL